MFSFYGWKVDLVSYVNYTSSLISFFKNLNGKYIYTYIKYVHLSIYWIRGEWKKRLESQVLGVNKRQGLA